MAKIFFLNELAPQEFMSLRGLLVFLYCFKYSGLRVTNVPTLLITMSLT
jgi:hypothetical protein